MTKGSKEKGCDTVSTPPVEATSDGENKTNGTTVEAEDTKRKGAPPGRDGKNLEERSKLTEVGEHSEDDDPADGALSEDAEMVRADVVAGVAEAGPALKPQVEEDQSGGVDENAPSLDRLFTSEELDLLMEGKTLGVSDEKEEYDKELEERLYPLDEVELKLRMKKNAEQQQELSLEVISSLLDIPVEKLARTRESSPGELSTPEYWLSWYKKTLAATEEARRANRNFQGAKPAGGKTGRVGAESLTASDGRDAGGGDVIGDELLQAGCDPVSVDNDVDESVVRGNILICMRGTAATTTKADDSDEKDLPEPTRIETLPAQYRRLVRQVVHALVKEEEQLEAPRCSTCKVKLEVGRSSRRGLEARIRTKMVRLRVASDDHLTRRVLAVAKQLYDDHADLIRAKIAERKLVCRLCRTPVRRREHVLKRRVRFGCSSLFAERSEALPDRSPEKPEADDLYEYVYSVGDGDDTRRRRKPGLVEVSDGEGDDDEEPSLLQDGKRVIGSVGGVEAVSTGYIDCTPVEMLIDTGAIASLFNSRVLKRVGRANTPLRPSNKDLNGVTGHKLRIRGEIDLHLRVGSLEVMRPFVVVDRLHVDTILGTDTLKELRAVIDLEENTLTLKGTGEVFPLGTPRVEEMHSTRIISTVHLRPGGQALVVTDVQGNAPEDATVLIEGLQEVDARVRVARTLCTVHDGKVLVEVCNSSTEEVITSKGTLLAAATVVPETAFAPSADTDGGKTPTSEESRSRTKPDGVSSWIDSILSATTTDASASQGTMSELEKVLKEELNVDFSDSKLNEEQRALPRSLSSCSATCLWKRR